MGCGPYFAVSQSNDASDLNELIALGDAILNGSTDSVRLASNEAFKGTLRPMLSGPGSFEKSFDPVSSLSVLRSDDGRVRLFTWLLPTYDAGFRYNGFVQVRDPKTKAVTLLELAEAPLDRRTAEKATLDYKQWVGALYYEIITVKDRPRPYYTLLGWRGQASGSTMKVIDVLSVRDGNAVFGLPVFSTAHGDRHRILFEYNPQAVMTLSWDRRRKMIVFDHLSPPDSSMTGVFERYGPDFTYDAFRLSGRRWKLRTNVTPMNRDGSPAAPLKRDFRNKDFYRPDESK